MKNSGIIILTLLVFFAFYLLTHFLFKAAVMDATVVEDGVSVVAYCFLQRQLIFFFCIISMLFFGLGAIWGDFLSTNNNADDKKSTSNPSI